MAKSKLNTAYHEAGHVVAYVRAGLGCDGASIITNRRDRCDGETTCYEEQRIPEQDKRRLIPALAGYAAEVNRDPSVRERARLAAHNDFEKARKTLGKLGRESEFQSWLRKAAKFVRENWRAIELVANELQETRTLDGGEIECIISFADGEPGARHDLARYRQGLGRTRGTKQFPYSILRQSQTPSIR